MEKISVNYLTHMGLNEENAKKLKGILTGEHAEFDEESIRFKKGTETFIWGDLAAENYEGRFMQTPVGFFVKLKNSSSKIQYFKSNDNIESIKLNTLVDYVWTTSLIQEESEKNFSVKTVVIDSDTFHMITDGRAKVLNMDMDLYDETIVHATNDKKQEVIETEMEANNMVDVFNILVENPYQILVPTPKM